MVKTITSAKNFVKTFVLSALLWGFADTLALSPLEAFSQQKPAVPTVHNRSLDEKCLKFCDNDEEIKHMNDFLSMNYNKYGSYLGSAIIQQNIDLNMFLEFLDGNIEILKRFDEEAYNKIDKEAMQKVTEKSEPIKQWLNENYFNAYYIPLGQFDHPPDAEEVINALDEYVKNDPNQLFDNGLLLYKFNTVNASDFLRKNGTDGIQYNSDMIAIKIHSANETLFNNLLKVSGLCNESDGRSIIRNLDKYMYAVLPVKYW